LRLAIAGVTDYKRGHRFQTELADWALETIVLVIHLILAVALVATVLLQRSEGGGLGMGGSGMGLMSVRGSANLLTRTTAILAAGFMATSIILAIMSGNTGPKRSILDQPAGTSAPAKTEQEKPGAPVVPLSK